MGDDAPRRVVVIGAASGIGYSTSQRFRTNGDVVAGLDIDQDNLAAAELEARYHCDVDDPGSVEEAIESAARSLGGIDVLVNSAGVTMHGTVLDLEVDDWDLTMRVNVRGIFLASKYAIPHLRRGGGGTIINIASQLGLAAIPSAVAYCASKGAAIQLTRAMAIDHAHDKITVNAVCPGPTATPLLERHIQSTDDPSATRRMFAAATVIDRLIEPEEVAAAVFYLAQPDARATTGSCLVVDGGFLAR